MGGARHKATAGAGRYAIMKSPFKEEYQEHMGSKHVLIAPHFAMY